jgi:hypothetical protein
VKIQSFQQAVRFLFSATSAILLVGCASTGVERVEQTSASMTAFRNDIINIQRATDVAMASLNDVIQTANSDPKKAFSAFSSSVAKLDKAVITAKTRAQEVKSQGEAYFKQWETEMKNVQNPEIRRLAETRKEKLQETFSKLGPLLEQTKADFDPFSSDVHDLQKYLSNDLTLAGIDSAKALISKTIEHGRTVQTSLDTLVAEMNTIAATITPAKPR